MTSDQIPSVVQDLFELMCAQTCRQAHIYASLERSITGEGYEKAEWKESKSPWGVTPESIWRQVQAIERYEKGLTNRAPKLLGVIPYRWSNWMCADIDIGSRYHPANDAEAFEALLQSFKGNGFEGVVIIQSSNFGGLHLWFPLPVQRSDALAQLVQAQLEGDGFTLANGQLEVFPNVRQSKASKHKAVRLPLLHPSSVVLREKDLMPMQNAGSDFTKKASAFVRAWDKAYALNEENFPAVSGKNYFVAVRAAQTRLANGFTKRGMTYELAADAAYVAASEGLKGAALSSRMCSLLQSCNGYRKYCAHQRQIDRGTYRAFMRYYSAFATGVEGHAAGGRPQRSRPTNHQTVMTSSVCAAPPVEERNRAAIEDAVKTLLANGIELQASATAAARAVAEVAGVSLKTALKHRQVVERLVHGGVKARHQGRPARRRRTKYTYS